MHSLLSTPTCFALSLSSPFPCFAVSSSEPERPNGQGPFLVGDAWPAGGVTLRKTPTPLLEKGDVFLSDGGGVNPTRFIGMAIQRLEPFEEWPSVLGSF